MLLHPPHILDDLRTATLFLDTNVFSVSFRNPELGSFLVDLREHGCALVTIPSVLFEVTRGSNDLAMYNKRAEALKDLVSYIDPMKATVALDGFSVIMAKLLSPKDSQYTDFLLAACLYQFSSSNIFLMTSDLRSMPRAIFDREYVITAALGDDMQNFGIFRINRDNYGRAAASLLSS